MSVQFLPAREIEQKICDIWADLLEVEVLPDDDFFDLGGDSLLVGEVLVEARRHGIELRTAAVFKYRTAAALAGQMTADEVPPSSERSAVPSLPALRVSADEMWRTHGSTWAAGAPRCLFPLVPEGTGEPLYVVNWGNNPDRTLEACAAWGNGRPVHAFEAPGYRGAVRPVVTVGEMAERFLQELLEHQPEGPYHLSGFCFGAAVAFEMARMLRARGAEVALLALVKPTTLEPSVSYGWGLDQIAELRLDMLATHFDFTSDESLEAVYARLRAIGWYDDRLRPEDLPRLQMLWAAMELAQLHYEPRPYAGPVLIVQPDVDREATEHYWLSVLSDVETLWLDFDAPTPGPIVADASVTDLIQRKLAR